MIGRRRMKRPLMPGGMAPPSAVRPHTIDGGPDLPMGPKPQGPSAMPMQPPQNPMINPMPTSEVTGYQNAEPKVAPPQAPMTNPMPVGGMGKMFAGLKGTPQATGRPGGKFGNVISDFQSRAAQAQPPVPSGPTQGFGPGNDLRGTQFNPTPSSRLTAAQGATGAAAAGVQNFNRGATVAGYTGQFNQQLAQKPVGFTAVGTAAQTRSVNPNIAARSAPTQQAFQGVNPNVAFKGVNPNVAYESAGTDVAFRGVNSNVGARDLDYNVKAGAEVMPTDTERFTRLGGQQDSAVNTLTTGPNRTQIAKNTLNDFNEQSNLSRQSGIRDIGKAAAKFGRLGAGMTTNDLTGLEGTLDRQRRQQENALASSVAEGDINDRFRTVDTVSGLRGQEEGIYSNRRGEQRTERDYRTGLDERNVGRGFEDRSYRTGLDERNVSRAQQERDAQLQVEQANLERQRQERDFKSGLAERNYGRGTNERDTEMGLSERNFGRSASERDSAMGLGERNIARGTQERDYLSGMDERNYGRDYGQAQDATGLQERNLGRASDERNAGLGLAERNAGRDFDSRRSALEAAMGMGNAEGTDALNKFRTASDVEGDIYGQEFDARNEQRGERGYQEEMSRYAGDQRIRQREMENGEMDAEFRRAALRSGINQRGAEGMAGQADGANDLLMDWMRRRQGGGDPLESRAAAAGEVGMTPTSQIPRPRVTVRPRTRR